MPVTFIGYIIHVWGVTDVNWRIYWNSLRIILRWGRLYSYKNMSKIGWLNWKTCHKPTYTYIFQSWFNSLGMNGVKLKMLKAESVAFVKRVLDWWWHKLGFKGNTAQRFRWYGIAKNLLNSKKYLRSSIFDYSSVNFRPS